MNFRTDTRGVAAIEFAVLAVPVCMLALGSLDLLQLAQARQGAAALATATCAAGSRAGFIPNPGGDNIALDFDAANAAAVQVFDTSKDSAFVFASPATFEAVAVEPNMLRCVVTVVVTPVVGFLYQSQKTIVQTAVE